jgi:alkylation response protein AidB-like acyl-CoA dehydrogenase
MQTDWKRNSFGLDGRAGRSRLNTQIYEGTNQIQRVVISKRLLG